VGGDVPIQVKATLAAAPTANVISRVKTTTKFGIGPVMAPFPVQIVSSLTIMLDDD
jgi:hypothetical protein